MTYIRHITNFLSEKTYRKVKFSLDKVESDFGVKRFEGRVKLEVRHKPPN